MFFPLERNPPSALQPRIQKSPPQPHRKKVFPEDLAKKILSLEEYFHNHLMNIEAVQQLMQAYVKAVELLDTAQPHLSYYFLEKLQFMLSRPEIIKILSGEQAASMRSTINNMRQTLRGTVAAISGAMENPVFASRPQDAFKKQKLEYDDDKKKLERSIKAQMYIEVEQGMKKQQKEMRAQFARLEATSGMVDQMLNSQQQAVEQRRLLRRKKRINKSVEKKPQVLDDQKNNVNQEVPNITELKQIQQEIHKDVMRFTLRQTRNMPSVSIVPEANTRECSTVRQDQRQIVVTGGGGGRVTYRQDDDD